MNLNCPTLPNSINLLVGLALDIDPVLGAEEQLGNPSSHRIRDRCDFRAFTDHCGIQVPDHQVPGLHPTDRFFQENAGVGTLVDGIRIGKEPSNIRFAQGTQEGIGHSMEQGVTIGMTDGACGMLNLDTAQHERPPIPIGRTCLEPMKIVSVPDTHGTKCIDQPPRRTGPDGRTWL